MKKISSKSRTKKKKVMDTLSFKTNTAWLLNMWFAEDSLVFPEVKKFIQSKHDEMWEDKHHGIIKITFKLVRK